MAVYHEVDFYVAADAFHILVLLESLHAPHIHAIMQATQLVIYDILHRVVELQPAEVKNGITDANVLEIIFGFGADIFAPFYIIAQCLAYEKRIVKGEPNSEQWCSD
mgnify:CR=1 FL=1